MKRFIKYFIISIFIFFISKCDVFAYNSTFVPDLILPPYTILAEWNTDTSYTTISMGFQSDSTNIGLDSQKAYFYEYMGGQSNDWNGTSIVFSTDKGFIANNSYNMSFVLCSQNSLVIDRVNIGTSTGPWTQALSGNWATINNWSVTTISDYSSDSMNFSPCRNVVVNFTSNYTGSFVALRFRSQNNSTFGNYLGFMGYIYDNEGKNYTTFFNEINDSINSLNTNINNQFNNLNDSITSEEAPTKLDNLNDSAGWLPAGPVDSILNLPLTMFQNLSNNMGSSCTPLDINLPYVDKNITLLCLNSIYNQIDGLSIWINSVGVIASAFILYSYLLKLYKWVDDTLTFRENNTIDNWGGI